MEYARDHFKVKKLWLWTPDKSVSEMYVSVFLAGPIIVDLGV